MHKLICIVGPTASGKSDLGILLAKRYNGEIVSADSRQIYKGLDIGSGKITKKEMRGIPHHLFDVTSPKRRFTASQYQKLAVRAIDGIARRGKLPILVGGTPFYLYAVIDGYVFPEVKPNPKLRKQLQTKSFDELFSELRRKDPARAQTIEKNKRRVIRALEIISQTGKPIPSLGKRPLPYDLCIIGIKRSPGELSEHIALRLAKRFKQGMIAEVKQLHEHQGLSWKRFEELGLEYRFIANFLQKKVSRQKMVEELQKAIEDFAKRQMTWFKKDPRIQWVSTPKEASDIAQTFLFN